MQEQIGEYIVCDTETARQLWKSEPDKRPFLYTEDEFRAMILLDTELVEKIEQLKQNPKGFVYKKGMQL